MNDEPNEGAVALTTTSHIIIFEDDLRTVLNDLLGIVRNDPDLGNCGSAYDEGSIWAIREVAIRLNITLEDADD